MNQLHSNQRQIKITLTIKQTIMYISNIPSHNYSVNLKRFTHRSVTQNTQGSILHGNQPVLSNERLQIGMMSCTSCMKPIDECFWLLASSMFSYRMNRSLFSVISFLHAGFIFCSSLKQGEWHQLFILHSMSL